MEAGALPPGGGGRPPRLLANAKPGQKTEIAQAISDKFREQDDVYQQARGMGAEAWGLGRGRGVMASLADGTESVSMVEVGGAGNIGEEGSA